MPAPKTTCKVTISLPCELLEYADRKTREQRANRSQVVAQALAWMKEHEEELLAAEGYAFYAGEATEFAEASNGAVAESWGNEG